MPKETGNPLGVKTPRRRTPYLLKGRVSIPGARYFITVCLQRPGGDLTATPANRALAGIIAALFVPPEATLLCATLMPDHVHLLLVLGSRLSLARLIARFKAQSRRILPPGATWQRNFFEHRLRADEPANDYARYIFLNPYRQCLLKPGDRWPLWIAGNGANFDFLHQLDADGCPPRTWLETPQSRPAGAGHA